MGESLAISVMERHRKRLRGHVRRVTIDLDPTDDPTHGAQQMSSGTRHGLLRCCALSALREVEQYLCAAVLRPGNVTASVGAVGLAAAADDSLLLPAVRIRVRLDGPRIPICLIFWMPNQVVCGGDGEQQGVGRKAEQAMQLPARSPQ